jgi:hypothetical protein
MDKAKKLERKIIASEIESAFATSQQRHQAAIEEVEERVFYLLMFDNYESICLLRQKLLE